MYQYYSAPYRRCIQRAQDLVRSYPPEDPFPIVRPILHCPIIFSSDRDDPAVDRLRETPPLCELGSPREGGCDMVYSRWVSGRSDKR